MKHLLSLGLGAYLTAFAAVGAARAGCPPPTGISVLVPPGLESVTLSGVPAAPLGSQTTVVAPTLHGQISLQNGAWVYTPDSSFWTFSSDRFVIAITSSLRQESDIFHIRLFAAAAPATVQTEDFESPQSGLNGWNLLGELSAASIVSAARMNGQLGLALELPTIGAKVAVSPADPIRGDGAQGSGATGGWKPPRPPGTIQATGTLAEATILAHLDSFSNPVVWVRMRQQDTGEVAIQLQTPYDAVGRPWRTVADFEHVITLVSSVHPLGGEGLAMLWLDGEQIDHIESPDIDARLIADQRFEFGLSDLAGNSLNASFDQLSTFRILTDQLPMTVECAENFETDVLKMGWTTLNPSNLSITKPGLIDQRSLAIKVNGTGTPLGGALVIDNLTPKNIRRQGIRFEFDTSELDMTSGQSVLVVDSDNVLNARSFRVLLDGTANGGLRLRVIHRHDSTAAPAVVTSFPITNGRHTFELDWRRSATDTKGTGSARAWLDGTLKVQHYQLSNSGQVLKEIRLGGTTQVGQPTGYLKIDDLETWWEP